MASSNTTYSTHPFPTSSKSKDDLLNEILTCGICLSRMSSPCCLPCAHSFCRSCLLDYAENNHVNLSSPMNYIRCPYCKFQLNFTSSKHFESMLVINPILKQLCEVLETSKFNTADQTNGTYHARCHICCSLKLLKVCKHCYFMLCETCRRSHLLDVHRESRIQLEILDTRLHAIHDKRLQMDQIAREYDHMRQRIKNYTDKLIGEIAQQGHQALQILDERQHSNDEAFWMGNGFDNGEKLDFFISLLESGKKKLSAKNITDRDLMELSDNLQTIPDVNEKAIDAIDFTQLSVILDETVSTKQWIHVHENDLSTNAPPEKFTDENDHTDCLQT